MSKEPYPSETAERFIVRFPDGMRDRIRDEAAKNNRSMNAEIIARLEKSFAHPPLPESVVPQVEQIIERVIERILDRKDADKGPHGAG